MSCAASESTSALHPSRVASSTSNQDSLNTPRKPLSRTTPGLPAGFHEVDPQAVVQCTREVLCKLLQAAPATTQVRFTSQMGGILLLDAQHKPITNYLSWRDQRSLLPAPGRSIPLIDQLRQAWNDQQFEELGKELKPGSATTLLCWLAQHQQLPRQTMPVTIGDYVIASICNAPAHAPVTRHRDDQSENQ